MRKTLGYVIMAVMLFNFFRFEVIYFLPILVPIITFVVVYNVVLKYRPLEQGHPKARTSQATNEFASEIKKKYNAGDPYDTIKTYDPALIEINRFDDQIATSTLITPLVNPLKKLRPEETMMFLNEGEQVIMEPPTSSLSTVAVYDRSKHLLGYIPKTKNNAVLALLKNQRIVKGQITELSKTLFGHRIVIEIEYKNQ